MQVSIPNPHAVHVFVAKKYAELQTEQVFVVPTNEHVLQFVGQAAHFNVVVSHLKPGLQV